MTIHPTHTCFDDALEILMDLLKRHRRPEDLHLVHGIVQPESCPRPFAHAWVEERLPDGRIMAWQGGIILGRLCHYCAPLKGADGFAASYNILKFTRYTPLEAAKENERHVTYGPWIPEYLAACHVPGEKYLTGKI